MSTKASKREVEEVLAFELAFRKAVEEALGTREKAPTREQFTERWQANEGLRAKAYTKAGELVVLLEKRGVGLKATSTPKVRKAIEDMVTIPPRTAYSIPGTASFSQSDDT